MSLNCTLCVVLIWPDLNVEQHATIVKNSITLVYRTKQTATAVVINRSVPYLFRDVFVTKNLKKDHCEYSYGRRDSIRDHREMWARR